MDISPNILNPLYQTFGVPYSSLLCFQSYFCMPQKAVGGMFLKNEWFTLEIVRSESYFGLLCTLH